MRDSALVCGEPKKNAGEGGEGGGWGIYAEGLGTRREKEESSAPSGTRSEQ